MKASKKLNVICKGSHVGTLALTLDKYVAFEYSDEWLENGFSISPLSLPLEKQVFIPNKNTFDGLFGVFADSLPDAWGQILLNRVLREKNIDQSQITVLDRLAIVGSSGMGALEYQPEQNILDNISEFNLDELAKESKKILNTEYTDQLDQLYRLGGTSGGARPKIMTAIDNEDWIIKFPAHIDSDNVGQMEYDYAQCALRCGINMPETRLFPSEMCNGYFGVKRFDRTSNNNTIIKHHMLTAAAILEADFRQPCLDYNDLMKLTKVLTSNNMADVKEMFRRMCFNVFAHNRDDHAKNFSFLYDENLKLWRLSPAYDLTYSTTYFGEHTTSVDGNGINPDENNLLAVGTKAGLSENKCKQIIKQVEDCVETMLSSYI